MEQELMRIGVSLPEKLLSRFDEIILQRGYSSRSEGIRDAIRNYIVHYEWMSDVQGERVGVITLVYSHSQRGLVDNLTDIQHEFGSIIQSSLHVHLDLDNCLEVIILRGEGQDVEKGHREDDVPEGCEARQAHHDLHGQRALNTDLMSFREPLPGVRLWDPFRSKLAALLLKVEAAAFALVATLLSSTWALLLAPPPAM